MKFKLFLLFLPLFVQASQDNNINKPDYRGDTPLHHAAYEHDVNKVKKILAAGAKVNVLNKQGYTPLVELIRSPYLLNNEEKKKDFFEILDLLLQAGAEPELQEGKGHTVSSFLAWVPKGNPSHSLADPKLQKRILEHIQKHGPESQPDYAKKRRAQCQEIVEQYATTKEESGAHGALSSALGIVEDYLAPAKN